MTRARPPRTAARKAVSLALALATCPMGLSPQTSRAAPPRGSAGAAPAVDDGMHRARAAYTEGQVRFDLSDFEGAIDRWSEAYGLLREPWQRARMAYNLGETHFRAWEVDSDAAHLRQSKALFQQFLELAPSAGGAHGSLSDDVGRATARLERIDRELAEHERAAAEQRALLRAIALSTFRPEPSPQVKAMRGTGIALTTAGALSLGLWVTSLALGVRASDRVATASLPEHERALALRQGERANDLAIASGVMAAAMLAVGVPLLIVARRRALREREEALQRLLPAASPVGFGVVWEGRF